MLFAALIFVASFGLMIQFFIAYCRSLISQAYALELSEQAHQVTGIDDHHIAGSDFHRMLELAQLCPGPGTDRMQLGAVRSYFSFLGIVRGILGSSKWIESDRKSCSYFAAVTLDRRMAHNRALLSQAS